jgi:hypothetical protein
MVNDQLMIRKICGLIFLILLPSILKAQSGSEKFDSIVVKGHVSYDSVTKTHRSLFGENYRKEWAADTKVPIIKISEIKGGLIPTEKGGGHQTHSIRLKDKNGKEWVLRSVEKYPEVLLPEALRQTFAKDWLDDNMSAQHPYSALMVPVIAEAVHVPHTNPIIGWVVPDKALGIYSDEFANTLCLLEEREPVGDSDNTEKMLEKLREDNDNKLDSAKFFRARLLDLFVADWDRHEDQWRWSDLKKGDGKNYLAIPRDRDDAFFVNQGFLPKRAAGTHFLAFLQGFSGKVIDASDFFYNGRKLDQQFLNQFSYEQWMKLTRDFVADLSDQILEKAVKQLPASSYTIRHVELLRKMKDRRDDLPRAMDSYYHFLSRIVDIQTSDKNEFVEIADAPNRGLTVNISKLSKEHKTKQVLFSRIFDPAVTKEIRLFTAKGNDSLVIKNYSSPIKLRLIGGEGNKVYHVSDASRKIIVYDTEDAKFEGDVKKLRMHVSNDTLNSAIIPANLYTFTSPSAAFGYNFDDGLLLGIGITAKHEGFRKLPYGNIQQLKLLSALDIKTFRIRYTGEWFNVFRNTDFVVNATAFLPKNTINFFGRGNESAFVKAGDYRSFYRAKFDSYAIEPTLRFHISKGTTFSAGTSFQYYGFDPDDNTGRFINNTSLIKSYDSLIVDKNKVHGGFVLNFENDKRDSKVIATNGYYLNIRFQAYKGLNTYSESYAQLFPEISFYKHLDAKSAFVIANRTGAGLTIGKTAFYQSVFLGGQENLLGYRKYRFAGEHTLYNNLEMRIRLKKVESYFVPGQLGVLGFYDVGRVWAKGEDSSKWHNGFGGAIYYAPIQKAVVKITAGHSEEGWYPYVNLGFRF